MEGAGTIRSGRLRCRTLHLKFGLMYHSVGGFQQRQLQRKDLNGSICLYGNFERVKINIFSFLIQNIYTLVVFSNEISLHIRNIERFSPDFGKEHRRLSGYRNVGCLTFTFIVLYSKEIFHCIHSFYFVSPLITTSAPMFIVFKERKKITKYL